MAIKRKLNLGFGGDPDAVNLSTLAWGQLGGVYESREKGWQMFKLVDAGLTAGQVAYRKVYDGSYQATATIANSSVNEVAGIATTTVTVNYFTLLRCRGTYAVVSEASLDGRGDLAFAHTANNSLAGVNSGIAPINKVVGTATAARGASTTSVALDINYL